MRQAQYLHDIKHAHFQVIADKKRGYDTLNIELTDAEGSRATLAVFFAGNANIEGAEISTISDL